MPYSLDVPGGVATHALGLARWLRHAGHEPLVVAPGTRDDDHGVPVRLLGAAASFRFNGSTARLALAPHQTRAAKEAVRDADVVHVHEPLTPGIAFAAARAAVRLVVTHHASFRPGPLGPVLRARAALLPRTRVSLAVSEAAAATARAATGRAPEIIPNAVDLPPEPAPRSGRPLVLFLGRDEPRKGFPLFAELAGRGIDADFVAAGPTRPVPHVAVLGQVSDDERERLLSAATVVVAPNLAGESFGLVLVEALAHGATLVASDLPAFRRVVADPAVVRFFPTGDKTAAEHALRDAVAAPAGPARARASAERFTWDAVGPRVLAAYSLAGRAGGPPGMA
ncbi:MAG: glycosyltransferase family 4 protein [Arachnia sp.]